MPAPGHPCVGAAGCGLVPQRRGSASAALCWSGGTNRRPSNHFPSLREHEALAVGNDARTPRTFWNGNRHRPKGQSGPGPPPNSHAEAPAVVPGFKFLIPLAINPPLPFLSFHTLVMFRRRTVYIWLCLLAAVLVGTVVVLSSVNYYVHIKPAAYIAEAELDAPFNLERWNATDHGKVERVPRIIHQTWKTETLPAKWAEVSEHCREMMPD